MTITHILTIGSVICALIGCSTTHDMSGTKLKRSQMATIQVASATGSGKGARSAQVTQVDGKEVNSDAKYVTVEPGHHVIAFSFQEVIDPGGSLSFTLNLFGNESTAGPRPGSAISSTQPIDVSGTLRAGATYYVDTGSMNFQPIPLTDFERQIKNALGNNYAQKYLLKGAPHLRER